MSQTLYNQYVRQGQQLVKQFKTLKYDICVLTIKVCKIQHGGHTRDGRVYSIKKFANDIGMKYSTLSKWIEEHKNVVEKITDKPPTTEEYQAIRLVVKEINNKTPKATVRKLYDQYSSYTKEDRKLLRMIADAKGIRNFTQDHSLKLFNKNDLNTLEELLTLTLKTIKKKRAVKVKKRVAPVTRL